MLQDELKLKDYDIEQKAQGVDKAVEPAIKAVVVKDKTLQIRFVYTGKGTTGVPTRGTYGPLISAISVESSKFYLAQNPSYIIENVENRVVLIY